MNCQEKLPDHTIVLRWHKAYPAENWSAVKTGLLWSLSFLGADLPKGCWEKATVRTDSTSLQLDYSLLGFNEPALQALDLVCDSIKKTPEYKRDQGIDLSRFLVLTLHSSWHYYRITGVEKDLAAFIKKYRLQQPLEFGVTKSCVAEHHRVIRFNDTADIMQTAFYAVETEDSISKPGFHEAVYEAMDFMPNGQLRFAVYDANGKLIPGSPSKLGKAGKPSKCLWCHEIVIQPLFFENRAVERMMSNEEFERRRSVMQKRLEDYRAKLQSEIDFTKKQDHTYSELLYISFMEPAAMRIEAEWKMDPLAVKTKTAKLQTHVYEEFPFLGDSYYRYYIDSMAGKKNLAVPLSVRETVGQEPDYFEKK